jgi:hypothetical protein
MHHIFTLCASGVGVGIGSAMSAFFVGMGLASREWHIVPILLWALYAFLCFLHIIGEQTWSPI